MERNLVKKKMKIIGVWILVALGIVSREGTKNLDVLSKSQPQPKHSPK